MTPHSPISRPWRVKSRERPETVRRQPGNFYSSGVLRRHSEVVQTGYAPARSISRPTRRAKSAQPCTACARRLPIGLSTRHHPAVRRNQEVPHGHIFFLFPLTSSLNTIKPHSFNKEKPWHDTFTSLTGGPGTSLFSRANSDPPISLLPPPTWPPPPSPRLTRRSDTRLGDVQPRHRRHDGPDGILCLAPDLRRSRHSSRYAGIDTPHR